MGRARYRYVPHTADVAFVAYGRSVREVVENAAEALLRVMLDVDAIARHGTKSGSVRIREHAQNVDSLVWYTLQSIASNVDERKLHAYAFKVDRLTIRGKCSISGKLLYKRSAGDPFMLEVKAVTPHGLRVRKTRKGRSVRILLDV